MRPRSCSCSRWQRNRLGIDVDRIDRAVDRLLSLGLVALKPWRPGQRDSASGRSCRWSSTPARRPASACPSPNCSGRSASQRRQEAERLEESDRRVAAVTLADCCCVTTAPRWSVTADTRRCTPCSSCRRTVVQRPLSIHLIRVRLSSSGVASGGNSTAARYPSAVGK